MTRLSPLQMLLSVFESQDIEGVLSRDWDNVVPVVEGGDNVTRVVLEKQQILFVFDNKTGNLVGIANWKE